MPEKQEIVPPFDRHSRFARLRDYLASKAPPGKLPGRQHIDPLEIPDLLPYLMLVDVIRAEGQPPRYQIRLVGTRVVAIQGADATGKFVEEVLDKGPDIIAHYEDILATRQPQYRRGQVATQDRTHVSYQRVAFPLASDGETVDMLIFVFAMDIPEEAGLRDHR
ncbi:MAG TPA: PAS domain-containing protein [Alphaproteobacteria bacterium]|nr:PAS domain-containing protein [Alphaproteobacteria bacterium]